MARAHLLVCFNGLTWYIIDVITQYSLKLLGFSENIRR